MKSGIDIIDPRKPSRVLGWVTLFFGLMAGCGYGFGGVQLQTQATTRNVTNEAMTSPTTAETQLDTQRALLPVCVQLIDVSDSDGYSSQIYAMLKRSLMEGLVATGHQNCDTSVSRRPVRVQSWSLSTTTTGYTSTERRRAIRVVLSISVVSEGRSELPAYVYAEDTYVDAVAQTSLHEQQLMSAIRSLAPRLMTRLAHGPLAYDDPKLLAKTK